MNWFQTLFSSAHEVSDPRIDQVIEQAINVVDPRLRALPAYRQRLRPAAQAAWQHVCTMTRNMPEPLLVSRERWSTDPMLRAIFATPDEIDTLFSTSADLRAWSSSLAARQSGWVTALLVVEREEHKRLGVSHDGDNAVHDVQQISVDFHDHRIVCPSTSMQELRQHVKQRTLNELYLRALDDIHAIQVERERLEQQRQMLQTRLRLVQGQGATLDQMLKGQSVSLTPDLKRRLEQNGALLNRNRSSLESLDDYLNLLVATLRHADHCLQTKTVSLTLDTMNIIAGAEQGGSTITLTDVSVLRAEPYTISVVPVCYEMHHLLADVCDLDQAERFL